VLKINLLPPYIYERRKARQAAFLFAILVVAVAAGMVTWIFMLNRKEADLRAQLAIMNERKAQVEALEQTIKAEEAKIPPIKDRMDYFSAVMEYNTAYPKLYEELAKYTYERVLYRSIQPASDSLQINAHARTIGDCGRYLLNIYRARHLFSNVTISAVPGYPNNPAAGFDFTVTCALLNPINPPAIPAALGGGTLSGASGGDSGGGSSSYNGPPQPGTPESGTLPQELPPPGYQGG